MEFVVDWNAVCLVCLQEGEMRSIFEKDERDMTFCDKIMHCSNIQIHRGMNMPEQICNTCINDLSAAYRFRTNCESSNVILKSFVETRITDLEIPAPNGQIYKYKPPSGLNVKRIKCTPRFEVKEEQIDDTTIYQSDTFTSNDEMFNDEDSNQPLSSFNMSASSTEKIKLDIVPAECENDKDSNLDIISLGNNIHSEGIVKEVIIEKVKTGKRGRPRTRIQKPDLGAEVTPDNISDMMPQLTTVTYVRKVPEDEKPLKICEICGNGYKYQHALDSHMRRHRNEKPFGCEFCDRAFVANVELRRHMRVHTGQKPYACRYCERRFSDFGSRIKHERTHTGERPYECPTCGKAFAYAHVLSVHLLTHTGEKKFKCNICGKGFTKKVYLQGHMSHHIEVQQQAQEQDVDNSGQIKQEVIILKSEPEIPKIEQDEEITLEDYKAADYIVSNSELI